METASQRRRYTDLEKQELIAQWKASGKAKSTFCKEKGIGYFTFCDWVGGRKRKPSVKPKGSFLPVEIKGSAEQLFTQLILKNGTTVNIYQPVEAAYLAVLLKS